MVGAKLQKFTWKYSNHSDVPASPVWTYYCIAEQGLSYFAREKSFSANVCSLRDQETCYQNGLFTLLACLSLFRILNTATKVQILITYFIHCVMIVFIEIQIFSLFCIF